MLRLLYCSISLLELPSAIDEVASIVRTSAAHNASINVTGALIYTGSHFAQALEGEASHVERLMKSITADRRHRRVTVIHQDDVSTRRFSRWGMAYRGSATYVGNRIEELLRSQSDGEALRAVHGVYDLMTEFAES